MRNNAIPKLSTWYFGIKLINNSRGNGRVEWTPVLLNCTVYRAYQALLCLNNGIFSKKTITWNWKRAHIKLFVGIMLPIAWVEIWIKWINLLWILVTLFKAGADVTTKKNMHLPIVFPMVLQWKERISCGLSLNYYVAAAQCIPLSTGWNHFQPYFTCILHHFLCTNDFCFFCDFLSIKTEVNLKVIA